MEIALADLKKIVPKAIEGAGLMVTIQHGTVNRFFSSLGMQLAGVRYRFANDGQEALRILIEHDPTLNDIVRQISSLF